MKMKKLPIGVSDFKQTRKNETVETAAEKSALKQIADKKYETETS
jgi:hypothetical protein